MVSKRKHLCSHNWIIQCEGTMDTFSVNWFQDAPIIDIDGDQPFLLNDLIEMIISVNRISKQLKRPYDRG